MCMYLNLKCYVYIWNNCDDDDDDDDDDYDDDDDDDFDDDDDNYEVHYRFRLHKVIWLSYVDCVMQFNLHKPAFLTNEWRN